jgi:hypothetical protein
MQLMKKPKAMHEPDCDCEMCHGGKMAKGGDVEAKAEAMPMEHEGEDDLHEAVGQEMMDAIHSKDHKKMMHGLEAMVLRCMNKRGEES